jgi:hypothetical protein
MQYFFEQDHIDAIGLDVLSLQLVIFFMTGNTMSASNVFLEKKCF